MTDQPIALHQVKEALRPLVNDQLDPVMLDAWLTDLAAAAIAALGWQPFDTAPKDGSVFLVWSPGGFAAKVGEYPPSIDMCEWSAEHDMFIKHGCGLQYVTHWQPMIGPDAPESRTIPGQARLDADKAELEQRLRGDGR